MNIGTDIIEIDRVKKAIENGGQAFLDKVYTKTEQEYCESRNTAKYQHYAGRFAAKEAIYKAISDEVSSISWTDIEIISLKSGKPKVLLFNKESNVDISISHCKEYATAVALKQ